MSKAEVQRFAEAVRSDKGLQDELKSAATSNEAIVNFAKSKGYDVELDEMVTYIESKKAELSEEKLDELAGGGSVQVQTNVQVQAEVQVAEVAQAAAAAEVAEVAVAVIVAT